MQASVSGSGLLESAPEHVNGAAGRSGGCGDLTEPEFSWEQLNGAVNGHTNGFAAADLETQVRPTAVSLT